MGEISKSSDANEEPEKLAQVHRQPPVPSVRYSLDAAGGSNSRQQAVSQLAQLAQLTIQNERLSKENHALRCQQPGLLGGGDAEDVRRPPIRYNPGKNK